ncbi:hypothetical protein BGW39_005439 [Mortierella sp. 14UC]|nr:hypothetical protein BGW39_005439 [Mortierella sp. 14UC]
MAQLRAGLLFDGGLGVTQDFSKALGWVLKAVDQGYSRTQYELGIVHRDGKSVSRDYSMASFWFQNAARQEFKKVITWLLKAIDDDPKNNVAPYEMGLMYSHGLGVTQDYPTATEWFVEAAKLGNKDAQVTLGVMFRTGREGSYRIMQGDGMVPRINGRS